MTTHAAPAIVLAAGPPECALEVRFERLADRFEHHVACVAGRNREHLLRSVESRPPDRWPESPPLQQCHQQALPDGRQAVFAVGQAGSGHWSLVAACRPDLPVVWYEVACRFRPSPDDAIARLGSTYSISHPWRLDGTRSATLLAQAWRCQLQIEPGDEASTLRNVEDGLRLRVPHRSDGGKTTTRTWKYQVRLEPVAAAP